MAQLAAQPLAGVEVHWVTRGERSVYSGMVSGWVAGEYARDACTLDLAALARAAGVLLHPAGAVGLDAGRRIVTLQGGETLEGDVLALGLGSASRGAELPGVREHAWNVKTLPTRFERLPAVPGPSVVVGGGLAGIELALCLRSASAEVTLLSDQLPVPPGGSPALLGAVRRTLERRGIRLVRGTVVAVTADAVVLADGTRVPARGVLWATGPAPHPLLTMAGFALGQGGGVRVDATLRSTSHPHVFAAGDCADLPTPAPKSGVYSVREGPVLAHNLRAALGDDGALRHYRPQRIALALVNCGDGTGILSWGPFATRGRWVRAWKHRLDDSFMEKLRGSAQRTVP